MSCSTGGSAFSRMTVLNSFTCPAAATSLYWNVWARCTVAIFVALCKRPSFRSEDFELRWRSLVDAQAVLVVALVVRTDAEGALPVGGDGGGDSGAEFVS